MYFIPDGTLFEQQHNKAKKAVSSVRAFEISKILYIFPGSFSIFPGIVMFSRSSENPVNATTE